VIAALLAASAAAVSSPVAAPAAEDEIPAFGALGPQPAGATSLTATACRPFHGVRFVLGFW